MQHSDKRDEKDAVRSIHASLVIRASAEDNRTVREEAEACKERQDCQLKIDPRRSIVENVNSVKQRSDISSIFSSDSDDDIFSTFSSKSKTNALVSKSHVGNDDVQSLPFSRERSSITSVGQTQIPKTDFKLKNLFDSDDEDIFASTISVKKQEQESIRDKENVLRKVIQEPIISKKDESVLEKKEIVAKSPSTSKPRRVDIFGDDSDVDLFS